MKTKVNIDLHNIALYFCFTLGGCLFLFGHCGILNMFVSYIVGLISFVLFYYFCRLPFCKTAAGKYLLTVFCVITKLFIFIEYLKFTTKRILLYTPNAAIVLLFLAVITVFCFSKEMAIKKFSLLFSFVGMFLCLFIIIAALSNFEFSNAECMPNLELKEILRNYFIIFFPLFIPSVNSDKSLASGIIGITAASVIIIAFSTLTVCTFGRLNTYLDYPILALSDTINYGKIFTRLGFYLHAVIYVTGLIRCAISLKRIKSIWVGRSN